MVRISFQDIHVKAISNSSGIFNGENRQTYWRSRKKTNEGLGSISGYYNKVTRGKHAVVDPDFLDLVVRKTNRGYPKR